MSDVHRKLLGNTKKYENSENILVVQTTNQPLCRKKVLNRHLHMHTHTNELARLQQSTFWECEIKLRKEELKKKKTKKTSLSLSHTNTKLANFQYARHFELLSVACAATCKIISLHITSYNYIYLWLFRPSSFSSNYCLIIICYCLFLFLNRCSWYRSNKNASHVFLY